MVFQLKWERRDYTEATFALGRLFSTTGTNIVGILHLPRPLILSRLTYL